jgi:Tc5 transposase DNA-binding domain
MATCLANMESEQHQSPENEHGDYQWMSMGAYSHSASQTTSPVMPEYNPYTYASSGVMPVEPAPFYGMARPPPYSSHQQLQPLHPLIVPPQWPSMITSQSSYSATSLPSASITTPTSAVSSNSQPLQIRQTTTGGNTPRRTLTDEDRRRMCQYAEDNPGVKQTDIGCMFATAFSVVVVLLLTICSKIRRRAKVILHSNATSLLANMLGSTVSKVLRQKEKYLFPHDGSQSPAKKSKGKFPDIERALANWARNESKRFPLTDSMIREKARFFAATVGNNESQSKLNSTTWLERFKQKNNLVGGRLRKSPTDSRPIFSEDGITILDSSTTSTSHTSAEMSPMSPDDISPTTSDSSRGTARHEISDGFFDFAGTGYRHTHSQSATSLNTGYSGVSIAPLPVSSPTSSQLTDADGVSPFTSEGSTRLPPLGSSFSRPRSQTVPNLILEPGAMVRTDPSDEITPKLSDPSAMTNMLESPLEGKPILTNPFDGMKRTNSLPGVHTNRDTSMQPPPLPKSETASPVNSPVISPTQQEARRALELVMTFFQSQPAGVVEPTEYMTMGKLMQKLELAQSPDGTPSLPGGLHRIDEEEGLRVSKKRSIRSL